MSDRPAPLVRALERQLGARRIETHISWVLLAGETAWKIKKPVRLPFLDFSTLASRRRMCEEELRLNRRLAPSLYEAVVPVTGSPQAPRLGGRGTPIEFALRMRRFPDGALLSERLAAGTLEPALIDRLATRIARFHRDAARADAGGSHGTPERIEGDMRHVLAGLAAHGTPAAVLATLEAYASSAATALQPTWRGRLAGGQVRECHGDLHLANTVVIGDDVTAFDGIEFDPALRWIDVMADAAFLVMDLMAHGRSDLAARWLDRYLTDTGDHAGVVTLRYYMVYRALVRAMVATLRPSSGGPDYLRLALALASAPATRLLLMHGVSGSGKSWIAERLLEATGAIRLRSDVERKRLHGLAPLDASAAHIAGGIYDAGSTQCTYARLHELAAALLAAGWPVIVDATFLRASERDAFHELARGSGVPFGIVACRADDTVLRARLAARAAGGGDPSEADAAVLARQQLGAEPLRDDERAFVIEVDTSRGTDVSAIAMMAARCCAPGAPGSPRPALQRVAGAAPRMP